MRMMPSGSVAGPGFLCLSLAVTAGPALAETPPGQTEALFTSVDEPPRQALQRDRWNPTLLGVQLSVSMASALLGGGIVFTRAGNISAADGPFWTTFLPLYLLFDAVIPPLATWLIGKEMGGTKRLWGALLGTLAAQALGAGLVLGLGELRLLDSWWQWSLLFGVVMALSGASPVIAYHLAWPRPAEKLTLAQEPEAHARRRALRATVSSHLRSERSPRALQLLALTV